MWDAERNRVYAQRCRAVAVAMQNIAEEAARLRTIFVQQLQANPAEFAAVEGLTKAEITTYQSYLTELVTFHNGGGSLGDTNRGVSWALPLIDTDPA